MKMILYSHGFGVDKTDRGLFTEIASHLSEYQHIMFGYNTKNNNGQIVTTALDKQAKTLKNIYKKTKSENPNTGITLICHSQGCIVAALAKLPVENTFFLAPPFQTISSDDKLRKMVFDRPGTKVLRDGSTEWPRSDGSTTIISKAYWESYDTLPDITNLYNSLTNNTKLTIFIATNDELLGHNDYSELADTITIVPIETGHNFANTREEVANIIKEILDNEERLG